MMNTQNNIPEEIQWQIFELLEGNLTAEESEKTLHLIESNSDYQTFYHELSLTYLKPEPAEYPNKSVLLKSSPSTFKIWRNLSILVSSAAAIAMLMLYKTETPLKTTHSISTSPQKTASVNHAHSTESTVNITAPALIKHLKKANPETLQKDTQPAASSEVATQFAKVDVPNNKPFRVIRIMEDPSNEFTSPSGEINPDNSTNTIDPEVQIVYTGFDRNASDASETSQTEFLLDIAENLRYGRLPKMKLVPRRRQNHLIPQVDMLVGTDTRFIQTTLIQ
ncbi:MAG: hypothetical protein NBV77_05075 [Bacteroidia bacterium]|nr:hypothetical protein [Bacteroidia bacterium]